MSKVASNADSAPPPAGARHTDNGMANPDDNLRIPEQEGAAPRPATEPVGSEGSSRHKDSRVDPATGAPDPKLDRSTRPIP